MIDINIFKKLSSISHVVHILCNSGIKVWDYKIKIKKPYCDVTNFIIIFLIKLIYDKIWNKS